MATLPSIETIQPNLTMVTMGDTSMWFSYKTLVAFKVANGPRVVRQNDWAQTTGKHLNAIDGGGKSDRVDGETFARLWTEHTAAIPV